MEKISFFFSFFLFCACFATVFILPINKILHINIRHTAFLAKTRKIVLTQCPDRDDFAEHAVTQRVFPDHLELVSCVGRQSVYGNLSAARRRHRYRRPVRHARFLVPVRENIPDTVRLKRGHAVAVTRGEPGSGFPL